MVAPEALNAINRQRIMMPQEQANTSAGELAIRRFWRMVVVTPECWNWDGTVSNGGYAKFRWNDKVDYAHRFAYEAFIGPLIDGMNIDHLCRNRKCVNPNHLEQVTPGENTLRGISPSAENARRDLCIRGHVLTPRPGRPGRRECKPCNRYNQQQRRARAEREAAK